MPVCQEQIPALLPRRIAQSERLAVVACHLYDDIAAKPPGTRP
jgi:hypothetical protein